MLLALHLFCIFRLLPLLFDSNHALAQLVPLVLDHLPLLLSIQIMQLFSQFFSNLLI